MYYKCYKLSISNCKKPIAVVLVTSCESLIQEKLRPASFTLDLMQSIDINFQSLHKILQDLHKWWSHKYWKPSWKLWSIDLLLTYKAKPRLWEIVCWQWDFESAFSKKLYWAVVLKQWKERKWCEWRFPYSNFNTTEIAESAF